MTSFKLTRGGGSITVSRAGGGNRVGSYPGVDVHGCEVGFSGRGSTHVHDVEAMWEDEHGRLQLSGNGRAGPDDTQFGLGSVL